MSGRYVVKEDTYVVLVTEDSPASGMVMIIPVSGGGGSGGSRTGLWIIMSSGSFHPKRLCLGVKGLYCWLGHGGQVLVQSR